MRVTEAVDIIVEFWRNFLLFTAMIALIVIAVAPVIYVASVGHDYSPWYYLLLIPAIGWGLAVAYIPKTMQS